VPLIHEDVVHDREQPRTQIAAGLPQAALFPRPGQRVLDQIVGARRIAHQHTRVAAQPWNCGDQIRLRQYGRAGRVVAWMSGRRGWHANFREAGHAMQSIGRVWQRNFTGELHLFRLFHPVARRLSTLRKLALSAANGSGPSPMTACDLNEPS